MLPGVFKFPFPARVYPERCALFTTEELYVDGAALDKGAAGGVFRYYPPAHCITVLCMLTLNLEDAGLQGSLHQQEKHTSPNFVEKEQGDFLHKRKFACRLLTSTSMSKWPPARLFGRGRWLATT